MGSRRSRRANGRAVNVQIKHKPKGVISKAQKHANRALHKANVLSAARAAREATREESPYLVGFFSLTSENDGRLENVAQTLKDIVEPISKQDGGKKKMGAPFNIRPFSTICVKRQGKTARQVLISALDMAKVVDMIVFVFDGRDDMDNVSISVIDALRSQGLSTVHAIAIGQGRTDHELRMLRSRQLAAESLGEEHCLRPIQLDLPQDPADELVQRQQQKTKNVTSDEINRAALRRLFAKAPHQVTWRSRYGYMLIESAGVTKDASEPNNELSITGWVRGRGFSANELVHITGYGSFIAREIVNADTSVVLSRRDESGEPIESEAPVDDLMGEQTWPPEVDENDDDDVMCNAGRKFSVNENGEEHDDIGLALAKEYDAGIDEEDDEAGGDMENGIEEQMDTSLMMPDGGRTETTGTEDHDDMDLGGDEDLQIDEDEVKRARNAARTDMEFPDEVDTPLNQPAKVRFARYRGLKSLRTGEWDPKEQLPRDYASLFQFRNLSATRKRVFVAAAKEAELAKEAKMNSESNFVSSGKKVTIKLVGVSQAVRDKVIDAVRTKATPVVACGMLRHENRTSVVHFAVRRVDDEGEDENGRDADVIKAKMPLEMQCGFVRFQGKPMFSEHNANSDKHKMERYLTHGKLTVVSFYGPSVYNPAPALLCHPDGLVVATGHALGANPDRIILKRIILTGYPFKTQKKRTVAKFMFFNPGDVRWFKPVELWTKLGRVGHISEPIGTHGHMKCIFDGVVMHHDTICMTLYKRVYPKKL